MLNLIDFGVEYKKPWHNVYMNNNPSPVEIDNLINRLTNEKKGNDVKMSEA
jgi:hypothetical protein